MSEVKFYSDINLNKNALVAAKYENLAVAPTAPAAGQIYFDTVSNKFYGWNGTAWVDLSQVVTNAVNIKGEISNANTNPVYPVAPTVGDQWIITTNAGTVGGTVVEVGDSLIYSTSGWFVLQANLVDATTAIKGIMRLATQAEVNTGALTNVAVSPSTLATFLANYLYARKVRVAVVSLVANTPTTITHGLNVANTEDVQVQIYQGGSLIYLAVAPTTANAIQITSNITLANVTVIVQG